MRKKLFLSGFLLVFLNACMFAQERVVKVDFVSNSFIGAPSIPFDKHFSLEGVVYKEIDYVEVLIQNEGSDKVLNKYIWNRDIRNESETFSIVVPAGLKSNSKYDFSIMTYKTMTQSQKVSLMKNLEKRIYYFLSNNFQFDGNKISINSPKFVYENLQKLINSALSYQISKNGIKNDAPSSLVYDELKRHSEFKFKNFLKKKQTMEKDSIANLLIDQKVQQITDLIITELQPYFSSQLVQYDRSANIKSVSTDREVFSIPINVGMFAWNKSITLNNVNVKNTSLTPGVGISIPFSNQFSIDSKFKKIDSFGLSLGVLLDPIYDANGLDYVTPVVNLPVYSTLGIRLFNILRLSAGVLIVGEKGGQDFNKLSVIPTAGLALELNLWMGIKK